MRRWTETIALVTGASRGIGRAVASLLAERGATVHACARSERELGELAQAYPSRIVIHVADMAQEGQVSQLCATIERLHGRLDVLIHNASVLGPTTSLEHISAEDWRKTLAINLDGSFFICKHAARLLRAGAKAGCSPSLLLMVSSSVGRTGRGGWGAYSVSKFGVEALVQIAQDELEQDGVICASINPGGTATQMRAQAYPQEDPTTLPSAERVASTMLLLAGLLTMQQRAARYSSRALFPLLEKPWESLSPAALPQD